MRYSAFGRKFTTDCGIVHVMQDLGNAMAEGDQLMLGGGNPSHIPGIEVCLRERMSVIVADKVPFSGVVGNYAPPQGDKTFLLIAPDLLRRHIE